VRLRLARILFRIETCTWGAGPCSEHAKEKDVMYTHTVAHSDAHVDL
jgi:hypothetical protein